MVKRAGKRALGQAGDVLLLDQLPGGGSWFGRATAGQEFSRASTSCAAKELAIDHRSFTATILEHRRRSARHIEIAQCCNYGLSSRLPLAWHDQRTALGIA